MPKRRVSFDGLTNHIITQSHTNPTEWGLGTDTETTHALSVKISSWFSLAKFLERLKEAKYSSEQQGWDGKQKTTRKVHLGGKWVCARGKREVVLTLYIWALDKHFFYTGDVRTNVSNCAFTDKEIRFACIRNYPSSWVFACFSWLIAIFKFPIHFLIVAHRYNGSIYIFVMSTASAYDFYLSYKLTNSF